MLDPIFQNILQSKWIPWKQMGLCRKCLGGRVGGDNTYICFAEVTSALLKFKTSHWCFLVFTLIPEFAFWHCRHFQTLIFSIFLDLSDSSLLKALIPQEKLSMDSAAGVPSCNSEDPRGMSRLEVGDLLHSRTYKAVTSLTSFVLVSTGRVLNTGPQALFDSHHLLAPLYSNSSKIVLLFLIHGSSSQESSLQETHIHAFPLMLSFSGTGLFQTSGHFFFSPLSFYLATQSTPLTRLT